MSGNCPLVNYFLRSAGYLVSFKVLRTISKVGFVKRYSKTLDFKLFIFLLVNLVFKNFSTFRKIALSSEVSISDELNHFHITLNRENCPVLWNSVLLQSQWVLYNLFHLVFQKQFPHLPYSVPWCLLAVFAVQNNWYLSAFLNFMYLLSSGWFLLLRKIGW